LNNLWWRELPVAPDGPALFEHIKNLPHSFFLDSSLLMPGLARYSFLGASPFAWFKSCGSRVFLQEGGETLTLESDPLKLLRFLLQRYARPRAADAPVPFTGGAVGYFSYDLGRQLEDIPSLARDDLGWPDMEIGLYSAVIAVDHLAGRVYAIADGQPEINPRCRRMRALSQLEEMADVFQGPEQNRSKIETPFRIYPRPGDMVLERHFDRRSYCAAVERAREYIAAGDIYVVNLSQRFSLPLILEPWILYCLLREINPAPCAAFLNFGKRQVVCASPERFLRVSEGSVETRPIKGTRPRGSSPEEDRHNSHELWHSEKDRAELVMVVDMIRSDLGRVCLPGSVRVPELYRLEEYATVYHLVSTVEGKLAPGRDLVDLLMAALPGGSVTGAPKIRAMEIIEGLEPVRRALYTGSIGYLGFDGEVDLNIVIRTILCTGGKAYLQVGGGITIDSDPGLEYDETLDKARALVQALGMGEVTEMVEGDRY
jgi:para-aminobenzoate synthetase component 1